MTDNASNFQKALTEFTVDTLENEYDDREGDVIFDEVADILAQSQSHNSNNSDNEDDDAQDFSLPSHVKCGFHTLNLIAATDVNSAQLDKQFGKLHHGAFGKCQGLWTAVRHSTKMHDAIGELSPRKKLLFPVNTCWNSKYDTVCRLLEFSDVLNQIFEIASIAKLKQTKLDFFEGMCQSISTSCCSVERAST